MCRQKTPIFAPEIDGLPGFPDRLQNFMTKPYELVKPDESLRVDRKPSKTNRPHLIVSAVLVIRIGLREGTVQKDIKKGSRVHPQAKRESTAELTERIKAILGSRDLTLYQVSEKSAALYGRSSPHYLPHNFYYNLRQGSFSPSIFQLFAFSRISGYRLVDWLEVFGFDVEAIPRLQVELSSKRTTLLNSSLVDPHTPVAWSRSVAAKAPSEDVFPLSQVLEWRPPPALSSPAKVPDTGILYAKIGVEDVWCFPELLPGSIVRVCPVSEDEILERPRGEQSRGPILLEHAKGLCCSRIRVVGARRIQMIPAQMPYAQVEFQVPQEARIVGIIDLEIRNLLRPERPVVPKQFAKRWVQAALSDLPSELGPLLRRARLRMGLSLREASAISREIARLLNDMRYFTAPGSLSDYEAVNVPPRHIHKIFTLCVAYSLDLQTVFQILGLDPGHSGQEPIPQLLTGSTMSASAEIVAETDGTAQAGFFEKLLGEFGQIPFFLRSALPALSGLHNPSLKDCFWVGGAQKSHPYMAGALLALVNRQKKKPNDCASRPIWQQPLYLVLQRDGTYLCGCCSREDNSLVLHTYPGGVHRRDQFRSRDAEIIGKVVAVARKL